MPIGGESSPIKILTVSPVFPGEHDAKIKSHHQKLLPESGSAESAEEARNAKNGRKQKVPRKQKQKLLKFIT